MESFLYEGTLRHRRFTAPSRSFTYSLFMMYLDLGELDTVFAWRWFWSTSTPNLAWFRRADHYGDRSIPLDAAIRDLVAERTGTHPEGPIRLLTHLRYLGHCFNPVSFYYCFAKDGRTLETVVAEVSNTPWKERHMYVLPETDNRGGGDAKHYEFKKAFHVSPFLGMDAIMAGAWEHRRHATARSCGFTWRTGGWGRARYSRVRSPSSGGPSPGTSSPARSSCARQ